jgi:transmembrane sensor
MWDFHFKTSFMKKRISMKKTGQDIIIQVITKYLGSEVTEKESAYLEKWINSSDINKSYFLQLKNIWEASDKKINLSDISTEKALKKVLDRITAKDRNPGFWFYWQRIAAVLFLPLLLAGFLWFKLSSNKIHSSEAIYNEVYAAFGTRSALKLADGSQVWLNSGSSLRYPDKFYDKERVVYLKGEAYFEVHSDKSKPFIVQTQNLNVIATGTKFNVMAFKNDHLAEVTLVEGKVTIDEPNAKGSPVIISELKPNEHLEYDAVSGKSKLEVEDVYKYIAWKDGKLIFRNEPLSEVVKEISKLYNVEIELQGSKLQEYRYRATFQDETLSEILKLLKISAPINYKELNRQLLPDGTFSKKKVIIFEANKTHLY